jgi:hypothetical protein
MGLIEEIGDGPLALDTVIFIYFIEEHRRFLLTNDRDLPAVLGLRILQLGDFAT